MGVVNEVNRECIEVVLDPLDQLFLPIHRRHVDGLLGNRVVECIGVVSNKDTSKLQGLSDVFLTALLTTFIVLLMGMLINFDDDSVVVSVK